MRAEMAKRRARAPSESPVPCPAAERVGEQASAAPAIAAVACTSSHTTLVSGKRGRRANLLPRNATRGLAPDARDAARLDARVQRFVDAFPAGLRARAVGGQLAASQVGPAGVDAAFKCMVRGMGGRDGKSLDALLGAMDILRENARARGATTELGLPVSAALAFQMIRDRDQQAQQSGRGSRGGASAAPGLKDAFLKLRSRFKLEIDCDDSVVAGAAPGMGRRGKRGRSGQQRKQQAGTFPLAVRCQLECLAGAPEDSLLRFFARSAIVAGVGVSVRIQESEGALVLLDEKDPTGCARSFAAVMKDGEPGDLFCPAAGFLGDMRWIAAHARQARSIGAALGQPAFAFPAWEKPHGSGGRLAKAATWVKGAATKDDIRAALVDACAREPLCMPPSDWGRDGGLNLTGHSQHGSPSDWVRVIGPWPANLPYERALPDKPPRGFSKEDRRALGHWLRDANDELPTKPAMAAELRARRERGDARTGIAAGTPSARHDMDERYTSGEHRLGVRTEQLRIRERLAVYVAAAIRHWCAYHRVEWACLPHGRTDVDILTCHPRDVPPRGAPPPTERLPIVRFLLRQ